MRKLILICCVLTALTLSGARQCLVRAAESDHAASGIALPEGASQEFRHVDADVRAVLQPEARVSAAQAGLPCKSARQFMLPDVLEIGKYHLRAFDLTAGRCWVTFSAKAGYRRAIVILGVIDLLGWGGPKNEAKAFSEFANAANPNGDPWALYFQAVCYKNGYGTPVDVAKAAQINGFLMTQIGGQNVFMSIGQDDPEVHRVYDRGLALLAPPTHNVKKCTHINGSDRCVENSVVDQDQLKQTLHNIDEHAAEQSAVNASGEGASDLPGVTALSRKTEHCSNPIVPREFLLAGTAHNVSSNVRTVLVSTGAVSLKLIIAGDESSRSHGLACVTRLRPHHGMVLVFPSASEQEMWMNGALVPLDMIWVNSDQTVTSIAANVPAPNPNDPNGIAQRSGFGEFVILLPAGEASADGLAVGSHLDLGDLSAEN